MSIPRSAKLTLCCVPVTLKAADEGTDGPVTFEALAYSGGVMSRHTLTPKLPHDIVVNLEGQSLARKALANLSHDTKKRVGHLTSYQNDKRQVMVAGALSAATAYRDEVLASHKTGYPWDVSQEVALSKIRLLKAGATETVNGQQFTGPLLIADKSEFQALAFVDRGADEGNAVNIAAAAAGESTMKEFDTWLSANDFDPEAVTDKQRVKLEAQWKSEKGGGTATVTKPSSLSKLAKEEREENDRQQTITALCHQAYKDHPQFIDQIAELGEVAIKDKQNPEQFELALLRATRHQVGVFKIRSRTEPAQEVYEAALCRAAGLPKYEKQFSEQVLDAVDRDPQLRHFSLQQFLLRAACGNGYDGVPGERIHTGNLRRVLKYALPDEDGPHMLRGTQFSTINLPGVFGNVANKEIRAGFDEEDQTWREIADIKPSVDFKTVTSYRLTDSLEYEELPKGGEIKHGTLGEESYTRTLKTYAKMLGLDRQDIINDDLSAFDDLRRRLGRGAIRKFNSVFWAAFMNNASFFTTARLNFISGATTNLGTDGVGLGLGQAAFGALKSVDGKRIGGRASILLVPPELEVIGDQLHTGGGANAQTVANTNTFRGKYRPVVVPFLSDTTITGNSTKKWYLLRDRTILAAMVASFLNGNQSPTVESTDADFNNLGILFRGFHDFAADQAEYLSGVAVKGEA